MNNSEQDVYVVSVIASQKYRFCIKLHIACLIASTDIFHQYMIYCKAKLFGYVTVTHEIYHISFVGSQIHGV